MAYGPYQGNLAIPAGASVQLSTGLTLPVVETLTEVGALMAAFNQSIIGLKPKDKEDPEANGPRLTIP